ncbi:hypothetical protein CsSME_00048120 [Camellia sinensis var. sinensis]
MKKEKVRFFSDLDASLFGYPENLWEFRLVSRTGGLTKMRIEITWIYSAEVCSFGDFIRRTICGGRVNQLMCFVKLSP